MTDATSRFRCPHFTCYRTYNSAKNLRRHMRAFHSETQKYECEFCGKQLASSQNLREHTYLHTGETPYTCEVPGCGLRFRQGSQLSAHRKSHHHFSPETPVAEFTSLKVSLTQLTTLPGMTKLLLPETPEVSAADGAATLPALPSLTNSQSMGHLPSFSQALRKTN